MHREIPDDFCLKSVTVSRTPTGKYYAALLFEYEAAERSDAGMEKAIGLDFSMKSLFVSSEEKVQTEESFLHCQTANGNAGDVEQSMTPLDMFGNYHTMSCGVDDILKFVHKIWRKYNG